MQNIKIIGVSGRIMSGKDLTAQTIIEYSKQNWEIKKYAHKLKQVASVLTGIPIERFESQDFKKTTLGKEWQVLEKGNITPMTVRLFLQKLGTEAMRNGLNKNVWVNALWADYKINPVTNMLLTDELGHVPYNKKYVDRLLAEAKVLRSHDTDKQDLLDSKYPNWIISDVRFKNEYDSIKDRGGIVIRLTRNSNKPATHPSETELDLCKFDYIIDNKKTTIDETKLMVQKFMDKFNIT